MILLATVGSFFEGLWQLFTLIVVFIFVLVITYYTSRWIGNYQKNQNVQKNLEVVETLKITTNKFIQIIRAGEDQYLVIAVGKDEIQLLDTLTKEQLRQYDLPVEPGTVAAQGSFQDVLGKVKDKLSKK